MSIINTIIMWKFIILVSVAEQVFAVTPSDASGCFISTTSAESLLIVADQDLKIVQPANKYFSVNETFYITCPQGKTNKEIALYGEEVICEGGNQIQFPPINLLIDFNTIQCHEISPLQFEKTNLTCQTYETLYNIGYILRYKYLVTIMQVCFHETRLYPIQVYVDPSYWYWDNPSTNKPDVYWYSDVADLYTINLDGLYLLQHLYFGMLDISQYITNETYLVRWQLIPSYAFSNIAEKYVAFDYANVVPIWNTLYDDWARAVTEVEYFSASVVGVATLPDSNGELVSVYMSYNQVPVPRWLRVTNLMDNYALYGYNNPYYDLDEVEAEFLELCPTGEIRQDGNMVIGKC